MIYERPRTGQAARVQSILDASIATESNPKWKRKAEYRQRHRESGRRPVHAFLSTELVAELDRLKEAGAAKRADVIERR
jgi:hypothetical protein